MDLCWRLWNGGMNEECDGVLGQRRKNGSASGRGLARTKTGDRVNVAMISNSRKGWWMAMVLKVNFLLSIKLTSF